MEKEYSEYLTVTWNTDKTHSNLLLHFVLAVFVLRKLNFAPAFRLEPNLGPLKKQEVLSTTAPISLHFKFLLPSLLYYSLSLVGRRRVV